MGLDMYLMAKAKTTQQGLETEGTEVAYWRKANQIRGFFVRECGYPEDGNCLDVEVSKEDLVKLLAYCTVILDTREDERENIAKELLPVTEGFFFGGNTYDEWYYQELRETAALLRSLIADFDFTKNELHYTDWW